MTYTDKNIVCADCSAEFVHSGEDQQRYFERGFTNEPKRCPDCRAKRKASGGGGRGRMGYAGGAQGPREMHAATCSGCGKDTEVPFKPTEGRPVYCRECFQSQRD